MHKLHKCTVDYGYLHHRVCGCLWSELFMRDVRRLLLPFRLIALSCRQLCVCTFVAITSYQLLIRNAGTLTRKMRIDIRHSTRPPHCIGLNCRICRVRSKPCEHLNPMSSLALFQAGDRRNILRASSSGAQVERFGLVWTVVQWKGR